MRLPTGFIALMAFLDLFRAISDYNVLHGNHHVQKSKCCILTQLVKMAHMKRKQN